jgi:hypothetical protein
MALNLELDPLAASYAGSMEMTIVGRVNMLDDNSKLPGSFGLITDPDETTPGSSKFGAMVLAGHKPKLRNVARTLRPGQRVSVHGDCYPYKVRGMQGGLMLCLRADQVQPLPKSTDETTWARVTVTVRTLSLPVTTASPLVRGQGVGLHVDLSGQSPSPWHLFCWLEGENAVERESAATTTALRPPHGSRRGTCDPDNRGQGTTC